MPPSLSIGAFVLGGVLLLISVLRGGFKLFGAEVTGSAGGVGRVIAFMAGVILIVTGFLHDKKPEPDRAEERSAAMSTAQPPVPAVTTQELLPRSGRDNAPVQQASKDPNAVVQVVWRLAQQEMAAIVASLTEQQKLAAVQSAMATGQDIYAIHVRITNVGTVPVDVSPDSLRMTFGGEVLQLSRVDDRRFLRPMRVEPNRYAEGILTLKAPVMVGGVVLAGARLAYQQRGVQVIYSK